MPARARPSGSRSPFARTARGAAGQSTRGVDFWRGGSDQRIFVIRGEYLYALNAKTGETYPDFGEQGAGRACTSTRISRSPARFNDSTGPIVVGNVVVVTGNTAGAGDGGATKEAAPRRRPRLRREDRQAAVDLPRRAAGRRIRQRHVGQRVVEDRRRSRRLEPDDGRRAARLRLHSAHGSDRRRVRRLAPGRRICIPTAWSRSTRRRASASGTTRSIHHDLWEYDNVGAARCSATSPSTAGGSRP